MIEYGADGDEERWIKNGDIRVIETKNKKNENDDGKKKMLKIKSLEK